MQYKNKWFMIKILDKDTKYHVLFGLYTYYWSFGLVSWDKSTEYNW